MVDIVRCDRPSGQAGPVPRPLCIEPGCTTPALTRERCSAHYQRWRKSPDFVFAPTPTPVAPPPDPVCPWCGPYQPNPGQAAGICPTCGLDEGEIRYAERVIADSSVVYAQEVREFNARRRKGGK